MHHWSSVIHPAVAVEIDRRELRVFELLVDRPLARPDHPVQIRDVQVRRQIAIEENDGGGRIAADAERLS